MSFDQFRLQSGATGEEEEDAVPDRGEVFAPVHSRLAEERLSAVRTILIDEVSMVSAANLELLFAVLDHYGVERRSVQFVCVGDFAQLKPVCPNWCQEARAPRV